ncbi:MAG: DUF4124 domain-containing protein [Porticoccaceae bacterium]
MKSLVRKQALMLLIAGVTCTALGQTVYKSVDANGNITYSDTPPDKTVLLETITLKGNGDNRDSLEQSNALIEQMANVTDRLKQDREDRDKARQEERAAASAERATEMPPQIYREEYYGGYYPYRSYYPYRGHHPYRGPYPYRPDHDKPRPPLRYNSDHDLNNDAILVPRSKLLTPGADR